MLRHEVHRKVHAIAATGALMLDPVAIEAITADDGPGTPRYENVRRDLIAIRDANRRQDAWVDRVYILRPARGASGALEYAVETDPGPAPKNHGHDLYKVDGHPLTIGLDGLHKLDNQLADFEVGYDNGFAPIYDRSGRLIGELGVKLGWAPATILGNVWQFMLPPFAFTIVLALLVAAIVSRQVTRPLYRLRGTIEEIGMGYLDVIADLHGPVEFREMAKSVNAMSAGLRERETIKQAFSGYLSRQVLDLIVREGKLPELKGERRHITVMFADIRNFTSIAESISPEEVVGLLGEFFERMIEVIIRNQGRIDKFLGDGVMVVFGAPLADPRQEEHAVIAAVEMQRELHALCSRWESQGRPSFRMGIGINSGHAVVGNIGSRAHMEYTAIGDTVNLAARLQTASKEIDAEIVVGEPTQAAVRTLFQWLPLGDIHVRGRVSPIEIFGVATSRG